MIPVLNRLATVLGLFLATQHLVVAAEAMVIRAKHVITMNSEPLQDVEVLVRNGKIVGIGTAIEPIGEVERVEVHTLMPGLIDAYSRVGLQGGDSEQTREVTPEFETAATINWSARGFKEAASEGVTTLHLVPSTDSVICGFGSLVKTAASQPQLVSNRTGMVLAVCSDPAAGNSARSRPDSIYVRQPTNRMGVVWIIRNLLQQTKSGNVQDRFVTAVSVLKPMLTGETRAFAVSRTSYDIETLLTLADEFSFQPTLIGGHEAYKVADRLAQRNVPVIFTASTDTQLLGEERTDLFWNTPGMLESQGVSVALAGGDLLNRARFAVRYGMSEAGALQAITTRPASMLGVEDRLGKIAAEYDADLIAFDGPPLEFTTSVRWVMVDGQVLQTGDNE